MRRTSDFPGPIGPDLVRIFSLKIFGLGFFSDRTGQFGPKKSDRTGPKISDFYLCFVVTCLCFQYFTIGPDPDEILLIDKIGPDPDKM